MRTKDFYTFMVKREQIRLNRLAGVPYPWTDDEILCRYKFTNVKRIHDRTTQRLLMIYDKNKRAPLLQQLLNCATYRYFGTSEFAEAVGWLKTFDPDHIKKIAVDRQAAGERVFTGAYVVSNLTERRPKHEVVVDIVLANLWKYANVVLEDIRQHRTWERVHLIMRELPGFGSFMAKEVMLDTMLTPIWRNPPRDIGVWTPVGPGARRGAARVTGEDAPRRGLTEPESLEVIRFLYDDRFKFWPTQWVKLDLADIQFQLCEFDKYERVRLGQGRPRSFYKSPTIREKRKNGRKKKTDG